MIPMTEGFYGGNDGSSVQGYTQKLDSWVRAHHWTRCERRGQGGNSQGDKRYLEDNWKLGQTWGRHCPLFFWLPCCRQRYRCSPNSAGVIRDCPSSTDAIEIIREVITDEAVANLIILCDELGIIVYAPKTKIYVYENGVLKTLRDGVMVDAEYNRFEPYEK